MLGQLGFTLPLLIILALEVVTGFLLLCPKPLNTPAVSLARASHTQVGSTIFFTLAGVLLLLLASPLYDGIQLYYLARDRSDAAAGLESSEHEARTLLSFLLTSTTVALMFFLRKLGAVVGHCERMAVSEAALLKQVKGLQSEYTRMADTSTAAAGSKGGTSVAAPSGPEAGADAQGAAETAELRRVAAELERVNGELKARLEKAARAQQQAESNLAALQTQSRGLENEYDRLLAEHDELRRQLQRAGLASGGGDSRFGKKDA